MQPARCVVDQRLVDAAVAHGRGDPRDETGHIHPPT